MPRKSGEPPIDWAIITALRIEREAVCRAFGLGAKNRIDRGSRVFWRGTLPLAAGGSYEIVVAQAADMANVDAALVTSDTIRHWKPGALVMVGIAGSASKDVALGDIVLGRDVYYYERGKETAGGKELEPVMYRADTLLWSRASSLPERAAPRKTRPDGKRTRPRVHQGVIACGEAVIAKAEVRDEIRRGHRKILAIGMEGYGFSAAVWQSSHRCRHLEIRAICDRADQKKSDEWQPYAASVAAGFVKSLLLDRPFPPRRKARGELSKARRITEGKPERQASRADWDGAPDVPALFGRGKELGVLEKWILTDRCKVVAILGMFGIGKTRLSLRLGRGGIGKTDLSLALARGIAEEFDCVIWRSLRDKPKVSEVLKALVDFVSEQHATSLPGSLDGLTSLLVDYLRLRRCLLILDNYDAVMEAGEPAGRYYEGYEFYGELLSRVAEEDHSSCLLLTSREKPAEVARLEGRTKPVRSLRLHGVGKSDAQRIFQQIGSFSGSDQEWRDINDVYGGNPLALEMVARHIKSVFSSNVSAFLRGGSPLFQNVEELLRWHYVRLTPLEKEIVHWLAIEREPVSISELREDILLPGAKERIPSTVQSLGDRLPVESSGERLSLQPVLIEYVTRALVDRLAEEVGGASHGQVQPDPQIAGAAAKKESALSRIHLFDQHAVLKATAKDFVVSAQIRMIVNPLLQRLLALLGGEAAVEASLVPIVSELRDSSRGKHGYAAGNVLNLLVQLKGEVHGLDFSRLTVREAQLPGARLHDVDFSHSDLSTCLFSQSFVGVLSVALSSDGARVVAGTAKGEIRLWEVPGGEQLRSWVADTYGVVRAVAFSPDGTTVASGGEDGRVRLWDSNTGQCLKTLEGDTVRTRALAFSPDGAMLAGASDDQLVRLWNVNNGEIDTTLQGHAGRIRSVAFGPDGRIVASASDDHTVRLWIADTGECRNELLGHTDWVRSVAFTPDGHTLASGSDDHSVLLWDVEDGQCRRLLRGHTGRVLSVAFGPDGGMIASGSEDETIRLWEAGTGRCRKTLRGHTSWVRSVCISPDGRTLVSGGNDQTVRFWDTIDGNCLRTLEGHSPRIRSVAFSPDGSTLASGGDDSTIRLWSIAKRVCCGSLQGHATWVHSVAFGPDGRLLASGSEDGTVRLWNVSSGECVKTLQGHVKWVTSVAFSPDGSILASGAGDNTIRLWDTTTGECLHTLSGHSSCVNSVAVSPDGVNLASGSEDTTIRVWDLSGHHCKDTLRGHSDVVFSVSFSPDGRRLASCSRDATIRLWDLRTGRCVKTLEGHTGQVESVAFDASGHTLASGGWDRTVRLWGCPSGESLHVLEGHADWVCSVAFQPGGGTLVSSSADGTMILWNVGTGDMSSTLRLERPYERMNITGVIGLSESQRTMLRALGAVEL